jgi:hypothetical protein
VREEVDGLLALSDEAERLETKVALQLERPQPTDDKRGRQTPDPVADRDRQDVRLSTHSWFSAIHFLIGA